MQALYVFCAAVGVPLVLWFVLAGPAAGDDVGDALFGAGDDAAGLHAFGARLLSPSSLAFAAAGFGVTGLALRAADAPAPAALAAAAGVAAFAAALNAALFALLRRSESSTSMDEPRLVGACGRVTVPVGGSARGRVVVDVDGQRLAFTARAADPAAAPLVVGDGVLVVSVTGGIATVTPLPPELG